MHRHAHTHLQAPRLNILKCSNLGNMMNACLLYSAPETTDERKRKRERLASLALLVFLFITSAFSLFCPPTCSIFGKNDHIARFIKTEQHTVFDSTSHDIL